MDREDELRRAIRDAPDDDAPRLVYADVLMERGDPRGEYISIACSGALDDARELRMRALWRRHGAAWMAADLGDGFDRTYVDYARGFPSVVRMPAARVGELAPVLAALPLAELVLEDLDVEVLEELTGSPLLAGVRTVRLSGCEAFPPILLARFLDSPTLAALRGFGIDYRHDGIEPRHLFDALRMSPRAAQLRALATDTIAWPREAGIWVAAACPALEELRAVDISGAALGELAARATFELRILEVGDFGWHGPDDHACARLADLLLSPVGDSLQAFSLTTSPVQRILDAATNALAALPSTLRSIELHLGRPWVTGRIAGLTALESVDVSGNGLTASNAGTIAALPALRELAISRNPIGDAGIAAIAAARPALRVLRAASTNLADARPLASLTELRTLDVSSNPLLGYRGMAELAGAPFAKMVRLDVAGSAPLDAMDVFHAHWVRILTTLFERKLDPHVP